MWDALTLLLILSPVAPPVPHRAPEPLWRSLKRVALALEVVGPHERWIDDYRSEVAYVRLHWRELADAPGLADADWLPPPSVTRDCRCFNLRYQRFVELRARVQLHHRDEWEEVLREAQQLGETLCLVDAATCPTRSWVCRRQALEQLRERIGPERFYAHELPPCVPLWRFQVADR